MLAGGKRKLGGTPRCGEAIKMSLSVGAARKREKKKKSLLPHNRYPVGGRVKSNYKGRRGIPSSLGEQTTNLTKLRIPQEGKEALGPRAGRRG